MAPNPFQLLPTIRSRCLQFSFSALQAAEVEKILAARTEMKPEERKLAAQYAEGCPGTAIGLDLEAVAKLHREVLAILERSVELRGVSDLFSSTAALAKSQEIAFENVLEVFYSLLTDLLDLSSSSTMKVLRNPALRRELEALSKKVDVAWIRKAVDGLRCASCPYTKEYQSFIRIGCVGHFFDALPCRAQKIPFLDRGSVP